MTKSRTIRKSLSVITPGLILAFGLFLGASLAQAAITPVVTETGKITLSVDGVGTNNPTGVIDVLKPAGATVRRAAFSCASNFFRVIGDGQVSIDGTPINWSLTQFTAAGGAVNFFHSVFADVTAVVSGKLNAALPGLVSFNVAEVSTGSIDGCILAVIFDDPAQTVDRTAILLFGGQTTTGDSFPITVTPAIDLFNPDLVLDFGLGIGFGFQGTTQAQRNLCGPGGQISLVDVNLTRMTSCAGNFDDAVGLFGQNGALLTVGGLSDSNANPAFPFRPAQIGTVEDELYDLIPFVNDGDTTITVDTVNPSNDDVIFFAHLLTLGTAIVGPPTDEIRKELLEGPEEIGIYLPLPTQYLFEITYTGPDALVKDTVPAEFEILELAASAGDAIFFDPGQGQGNSANRIEWGVPEGTNTLTVLIQTVPSPGGGHKEGIVHKPTSCGPLAINDGAIAFEVEVDPITGNTVQVFNEVQAVTDALALEAMLATELVFVEPGQVDAVLALEVAAMSENMLEPVVIVGPSNPLIVEAVDGAKPCVEVEDDD